MEGGSSTSRTPTLVTVLGRAGLGGKHAPKSQANQAQIKPNDERGGDVWFSGAGEGNKKKPAPIKRKRLNNTENQ